MTIETMKIIGSAMSIALIVLALYIRFWKKIDTTKLSADWSLILIACSGLCTLFYFLNLSDYAQLFLRANLILTGIVLYIAALFLWFWGVIRGAKL